MQILELLETVVLLTGFDNPVGDVHQMDWLVAQRSTVTFYLHFSECGSERRVPRTPLRLSASTPTAAEVSTVDVVPIRNWVSGVTGTRFLMSAQPKPSAHTMSPPTPTATETPGRFCSARPARMMCRARSTDSDRSCDGSEYLTDGARSGCGCRGAAAALMYIATPTITARSPPTARTMSAVQLLNRFLFFDMFTFESQSIGAALNPASDAPNRRHL